MCGCFAVLSVKDAARDILDELKEFIGANSRDEILDELSDICFGIGRLAGALTQRAWVPIPGSSRHVVKISDRMRANGCIRSPRHLRNGSCPSAGNPPATEQDSTAGDDQAD
jgi:hypothetical protein